VPAAPRFLVPGENLSIIQKVAIFQQVILGVIAAPGVCRPLRRIIFLPRIAAGGSSEHLYSSMRVNRRTNLAFLRVTGSRIAGCGGESTRMNGSVSLDFATLARLADAERNAAEDTSLESATTLDRFLASVERRAFRIAQMAVRDRDDALDIVQGAMLRLARSYAGRPSAEWRPLFYRILYNGIRDFQRRRSVRSRIFGFLPGNWDEGEESTADPFERVAGDGPDPLRQLIADEAMQKLESAVRQLPARQQQAFAMRCLEGLDVAETATAMGCSEGSVKTHYFRALQALRAQLGEVW